MKKLIILILLILLCSCNRTNEVYTLGGTYTCDNLPFTTIVFDGENNNTFYYYEDGDGTNVDTGTYTKKSDSTYIINSDNFNNEKITCKDNSFTITIDGVENTFNRISITPTIIE